MFNFNSKQQQDTIAKLKSERGKLYQCRNCEETFRFNGEIQFCPICGERIAQVQLEDNLTPFWLKNTIEDLFDKLKNNSVKEFHVKYNAIGAYGEYTEVIFKTDTRIFTLNVAGCSWKDN